jgi:hypothetical protein
MSGIEQKILKGYQDVSDAEMAFGTTKLLPKSSEIPEGFDFMGESKWNKLFSDMFFLGLESLDVTPKEGVDSNAALRCIKAHRGSWEPKHEAKEAGVAYMMSVLFEDATWEISKRESI